MVCLLSSVDGCRLHDEQLGVPHQESMHLFLLEMYRFTFPKFRSCITSSSVEKRMHIDYYRKSASKSACGEGSELCMHPQIISVSLDTETIEETSCGREWILVFFSFFPEIFE